MCFATTSTFMCLATASTFMCLATITTNLGQLFCIATDLRQLFFYFFQFDCCDCVLLILVIVDQCITIIECNHNYSHIIISNKSRISGNW
ncbi:hypothetical protein AMTRI_Chr06g171040 [Amborella trichopoda]